MKKYRLLRPLAVEKCGPGKDLSFYVWSETRPETVYVVELDNRQFPRGRCSCDDFQIRVEPFVRRGEIPERWVCKHIEATILAHHDTYTCTRLSPYRAKISQIQTAANRARLFRLARMAKESDR